MEGPWVPPKPSMIGALSHGESMHELSLVLTFVIVHCSTCSSVYYMLLVLRPPTRFGGL